MDIVEAWRKSRNSACDCTQCFYCDRALDRHEHDHYPVPKRAGGSEIVAACLPCHGMKDRITLYNWDAGAAFGAVRELVEGLPPAIFERLKCERLGAAEIVELLSPEMEARWASLTPLARIFYAKARSTYEDQLFRRKLPAPGSGA